mgnify:CR=1 FL=1
MPYVPGKTHVKEVCAVLNQAHKLQIGVQLLAELDVTAHGFVATVLLRAPPGLFTLPITGRERASYVAILRHPVLRVVSRYWFEVPTRCRCLQP